MPFVINQFYFFSLSLLCIKSNRYNYIWIAFLFLILDSPGGLFSGGAMSDIKQLPFLKLSGAARIEFKKIIPLIFLIKSHFTSSYRRKILFSKDYLFLLFIFFFYFFLGYAYGMGIGQIVNTLYIFLFWTLLFSFPSLLDENQFLYFDRLLFTIVIVAFSSQVFTLITGIRWVDLFKSTYYYTEDLMKIQQFSAARVIFSPYIIMYCFIKSFFYLFNKNSFFSMRYLSLIIFISIFSIFLSATRGWVIAVSSTLILVFFSYFNFSGVKKIFYLGFVSIMILIMILITFPSISTQMSNTVIRLSSVVSIIKGDSSEIRSYRAETRAPKVLKAFYEKPIFGWGFSNTYWEKRDRHVGHPTLLMNCGIVGYLIFMFFLIKWFIQLFSLSKKSKSISTLFGSTTRIFAFGLVFVFIINSSSHYYWGFDLEIAPTMALALLLTSANAIATQTIRMGNKQ